MLFRSERQSLARLRRMQRSVTSTPGLHGQILPTTLSSTLSTGLASMATHTSRLSTQTALRTLRASSSSQSTPPLQLHRARMSGSLRLAGLSAVQLRTWLLPQLRTQRLTGTRLLAHSLARPTPSGIPFRMLHQTLQAHLSVLLAVI